MKPRKTKDIQRVLERKGFILEPAKDHHQFYFLVIGGKKQVIKTYFSHGLKEYSKSLMSLIKKQLKFKETEKAEDFFDCPMSGEQYVEMLIEQGDIKKK
jgi:hypothetical protein